MLEGYGLSETSPVASFNHPDRERKPGSIGTPIEAWRCASSTPTAPRSPQGEVGEIAIRGHNIMKGYWTAPGGDRRGDLADGWFRTGDIGRVDEDGYYLHRRPEEGPDHPRRLQRLPAGDRGGALRAPGRRRGRRRRRAATRSSARRSAPPSRSSRARRSPPTSCAATSRRRSPPTSTRGTCGFVDALPKGPTGKILKREIVVPERRLTG